MLAYSVVVILVENNLRVLRMFIDYLKQFYNVIYNCNIVYNNIDDMPLLYKGYMDLKT